jgi:hypothetical protein
MGLFRRSEGEGAGNWELVQQKYERELLLVLCESRSSKKRWKLPQSSLQWHSCESQILNLHVAKSDISDSLRLYHSSEKVLVRSPFRPSKLRLGSV